VPTAVAPLTDVVQNVGGPFIDLHGLIPGGMGSHTFEPVPPDVQHLTATGLIILNGLDRETPTEKLALAPRSPRPVSSTWGNQTITAQD
jgi:zinc/manganese transport system substrate-binding protein